MMKIRILIACLFMATFSSCNDWLSVTSPSEIEVEEFLKSENGYKNALTGIYIKLKTEGLYGRNMTMYIPEYLAQHWSSAAGSIGDNITRFNYDNSIIENMLYGVFRNLYFVIAESNLIINHIDDYSDVFEDERMYKLIKGEALGVRAFCHMDVLRLWGPVPGTQTQANILPYATTVTTVSPAHTSYDLFVEKLLQDLDEAEKLLGEVDPFMNYTASMLYNALPAGYDDSFWIRRHTRMNYFAVCAMKARLYLWNGDHEQAMEYARKVIDAKTEGSGGIPVFSLATNVDFTGDQTMSLPTEHIFAIDDPKLEKTFNTYFNSAGVLHKEEAQVNELYESSLDYRLKRLWVNKTFDSKTVFTTWKFIGDGDMNSISKNKMPLMRLSEMYLIAIECGDPQAANLYKAYCESRGMGTDTAPGDNLEEIIIAEYNRDFYAEGQAFYMYKRLNADRMIWELPNDLSREEIYRLPLPKQEMY